LKGDGAIKRKGLSGSSNDYSKRLAGGNIAKAMPWAEALGKGGKRRKHQGLRKEVLSIQKRHVKKRRGEGGDEVGARGIRLSLWSTPAPSVS